MFCGRKYRAGPTLAYAADPDVAGRAASVTTAIPQAIAPNNHSDCALNPLRLPSPHTHTPRTATNPPTASTTPSSQNSYTGASTGYSSCRPRTRSTSRAFPTDTPSLPPPASPYGSPVAARTTTTPATTASTSHPATARRPPPLIPRNAISTAPPPASSAAIGDVSTCTTTHPNETTLHRRGPSRPTHQSHTRNAVAVALKNPTLLDSPNATHSPSTSGTTSIITIAAAAAANGRFRRRHHHTGIITATIQTTLTPCCHIGPAAASRVPPNNLVNPSATAITT